MALDDSWTRTSPTRTRTEPGLPPPRPAATLTRANLAGAVGAALPDRRISHIESAALVDIFLAEIVDALVIGDNVKLSKFGTFHVRKKKRQRIGRNPKTGVEAGICAPCRNLQTHSHFPGIGPGQIRDELQDEPAAHRMIFGLRFSGAGLRGHPGAGVRRHALVQACAGDGAEGFLVGGGAFDRALVLAGRVSGR